MKNLCDVLLAYRIDFTLACADVEISIIPIYRAYSGAVGNHQQLPIILIERGKLPLPLSKLPLSPKVEEKL